MIFNFQISASRIAGFLSLLVFSATLAIAGISIADDDLVFEIRAEGGRYDPSELQVPAGRPFAIHVINAETSAIEFESFELHRERAVQPGETITVLIPALSPGTYGIFDDFHRDTPGGSILVK